MYLSNLIKSTLIKERAAIVLYLINSITIITFYYLLFGDTFELYPLVLTIAFVVVYLFYKLMVYKKLYTSLSEGKTSPEYKIEDNYEYKDIIDNLLDIHKSYISKLYNMKLKLEEKNNLMSQWIHNMKTCVSVIELAAEEGLRNCEDTNCPSCYKNKEILNDVIEEKDKLQNNLEGALNVFRVEEFAKDYISERINLKELVVNAINSKKRDFIYSKVFPKVDIDERITVYTDKKWGKYVVEQIISNSIKYSCKENSSVIISAVIDEEKVILTIEDEGIGIKKKYLNRVFDLFFTGDNGRIGKKSTGIGLYMCKLVCEKLNNEIRIESEEGKGTKVMITYINAEI